MTKKTETAIMPAITSIDLGKAIQIAKSLNAAMDKSAKADVSKDDAAIIWRDDIDATFGNYAYATGPQSVSGNMGRVHKDMNNLIIQAAFTAKHDAATWDFMTNKEIGGAAKMSKGHFRGKTKKYIQAQKQVPLIAMRKAVVAAEANKAAGTSGNAKKRKVVSDIDTVSKAIQTLYNHTIKALDKLDNTTNAKQRNWLAAMVKNAEKSQGISIKKAAK
tara:strand:- start:142 stop:795 length:654 start_codon:yes stop_codon:yes gene_type:complete